MTKSWIAVGGAMPHEPRETGLGLRLEPELRRAADAQRGVPGERLVQAATTPGPMAALQFLELAQGPRASRVPCS